MALFRCGGGGKKGVEGVVTDVAINTEYVIDTGLSSVNKFAIYQFRMDGTASGNQMSIYDADDSTRYVRAQFLSGVTQTVTLTTIGTTPSANNVGIWIMSVNGGKITIHTGLRNDNVNKLDLRWVAS